MVPRLIEEIEYALQQKQYFSALALALILPDLCGQAEFPNTKVGQRYTDWFDQYIGRYENCKDDRFDPQGQLPYLSGKIVYSLRCSVLHSADPGIDLEKCNIQRFTLMAEQVKPLGDYEPEFECFTESVSPVKELKIHLNVLCYKLCAAAKRYYSENKNKFNNVKYRIIDLDAERERTERLIHDPMTNGE